MRIGRIKVTVNICLTPFASSSIGAKVSLLPFALTALARWARMTGPKVSGGEMIQRLTHID